MGQSAILQLRVQRGVCADAVHADGELDLASAAELDAVLSRSVREERAIDLDLSGVFFCDVRGVRLLAEITSAAALAGVAFRISGVQRQVARVCGLLRVQLPVV